MMPQNINPAAAGPIGEGCLSTELRSATFLRPDAKSWMGHARNPVSAILACGFGSDSPVARCAFHPQPARTFDRELLADIECCRLALGYENGTLRPEWF